MTRAQIEVIKDLLVWRYEPGSTLTPLEVYPNRDKRDQAKRRTLRGLVSLGMLEESSDLPGCYRVTERLWEVYREWWRTRGFRDPWETNILLP